jgi:hypothetical protein
MIKVLILDSDISRIDQILRQNVYVGQYINIQTSAASALINVSKGNFYDIIVVGDNPDLWAGLYPGLSTLKGATVICIAHETRIVELLKLAFPKILYVPYCSSAKVIIRDIAREIYKKREGKARIGRIKSNIFNLLKRLSEPERWDYLPINEVREKIREAFAKNPMHIMVSEYPVRPAKEPELSMSDTLAQRADLIFTPFFKSGPNNTYTAKVLKARDPDLAGRTVTINTPKNKSLD